MPKVARHYYFMVLACVTFTFRISCGRKRPFWRSCTASPSSTVRPRSMPGTLFEPLFKLTEQYNRLGLTLKYLGVHNWSLIHLNWALECASSNTDDFRGPMTIAEIKFHIGHVYELQQKYHDARRLYEQVLTDESKTSEIESATHTTLGNCYNCLIDDLI